jgi:hypothetical protein
LQKNKKTPKPLLCELHLKSNCDQKDRKTNNENKTNCQTFCGEQTESVMIEQNKSVSSSRKETECAQCTRSFWYIDPRPGGRPRQKCGVCSSRPPRYPWGYLDGEPNEFGQETHASRPRPVQNGSHTKSRERASQRNHDVASHARAKYTDEAVANPYPMPSPYATQRSANRSEGQEDIEQRLARIEASMEKFDARLTAIEEALNVRQEGGVNRSDWVDLCARLDIVEQITTETLGEVRARLETFSQDVKHIAVVPERQINEMFELVRSLRRYAMPGMDLD